MDEQKNIRQLAIDIARTYITENMKVIRNERNFDRFIDSLCVIAGIAIGLFIATHF